MNARVVLVLCVLGGSLAASPARVQAQAAHEVPSAPAAVPAEAAGPDPGMSAEAAASESSAASAEAAPSGAQVAVEQSELTPELAADASSADAEPEEPARLGARIELSLFSAPLGAAAGSFLCVAAYCDDGRAFAGAALGGAAVGVLAATLATRRHPIPFATAQAIEGGAVWGTFTSLYVGLLVPHADERSLFAGLFAGEVLGAGLGAVLERALRPRSGAVALANSGALWLPTVATLLSFAINPFLDNDSGVRGLGAGLLAAEAIGLAAGGLLGQRFKAGRVQVLLSDVGAVLLGGAFPLLAWLIGGDTVSAPEVFGSAAAGVALGFAGAYALTELLPRRKQAAVEQAAKRLGGLQLALLPLRQGGGISLSKRLH